MTPSSRPSLLEHESFVGDHALKECALQGRAEAHRNLINSSSRQPAEGQATIYAFGSGDLHRESKEAPVRATANNSSTTVTFSRPGLARGQHILDTNQVADIEAEAGAARSHLNPFEDKSYPTSLGSSVSSKNTRSVSQYMDSELEDINIADRENLACQPQAPHSSNTFRRTLAALSFPFSRNESSEGSPDPRPRSDVLEAVKKLSPGPQSDLFRPKGNLSSRPPTTYEANLSNWSRVRNRVGLSSLQEGSTIDNIVRKYYPESDVESFASGKPPAQSFRQNLAQLSDDGSFFTEDEVYGPTQAVAPESMTQHPRYARQVLNNGLPRSRARNNISSVRTNSDKQNGSGSAGFPDMRSKYGPQGLRSSPRFITQNHQPLEQVIKELRRQSGASISISDSSNSTVQGNRAGQGSQNPFRQQKLSRPVSEVISVDEETRRLAEPIIFYNKASIDPNWNFDANGIRVPIQPQPRQTQERTERPGDTASQQGDDQEDWQTVTTETSHQEAPSGPRHDNQTLSSFAETSDAGTLSTFESMSRLDSTERLVQHPGAHYEGQYRQLNVKQGMMPIMAPNKGPYRVNGYPANSMRIRPTQPYKAPSPLSVSHQNPFISKPPEVMSPTSRKPTRDIGRQRKNRFQPSSSITTNESQTFPYAKILPPKAARTTQGRARMDVQDENEAGSIFSSQSSFATNRAQQLGRGRQGQYRKREEWDFTSSFAGPGNYQHYGSRGNVNALASKLSGAQGDGFSEAKLCTTKNSQPSHPPYIPIEIGRSNQVGHPQVMFDIEEPDDGEKHPRQEKISMVCLVICNLFPPLLPFFAAGKLDSFMSLLTRREIRKFSKSKKGMARYLAFIWAVALVIGVVLFAIIKYGGHVKEGELPRPFSQPLP
jgi:hypothetical protein